MTIDVEALKQPFPVNRISWRVGAMNKDKTKAIGLAYIDARDVIDRLDKVCGVENWQNKHPHATIKTSCTIGIKIGDEWIWKENGAGDSQVEAEKGAFSDSFKRAAVLWGIGRYLYDMPNIWVEVDEFRQIKQTEYKKLEASLNKLMIETFGKEKDKGVPGSMIMGLSRQQQEEVYDQAVEKIEGATDMDSLTKAWEPYAKTIKTFEEDLKVDLIMRKDNAKTRFMNGAHQ